MKNDFSYLYVLVALVPIFMILFASCPSEATSVKESVETVESSSMQQSSETETVETVENSVSVEKTDIKLPYDKVEVSVNEAIKEIEYMTQTKKVAILLDGFSIFLYDNSLQVLLKELEGNLTSSNVSIYLCNKSSYNKVISYKEILTPEEHNIAIGNYFEIVAQLRKEKFESYIILSGNTISFFHPFEDEYLDTYYSGLFGGSKNPPQVMLYTPVLSKEDIDENILDYMSNNIKSYKNKYVDVKHHVLY